MKKFTFLMAMIFAMLINVNAGTRTIYLDAGIWNFDGALFAAWAWNANDEGAAYEFTSVEGSIYKTEVNDDAVAIIFLRQDPTKVDAENIWDSEWNRAQTGIYPDKNMFTITSWEDPWGTWSTYGAAVEPEPNPDPNPTGTRTIYLDANIWNVDGAVFAAHVWNIGDEDAADYTFTLVEGSVYKAEIRDDATAIIFLRQDPATVDPTNVWASEWNRAQTAIPADMDMFTITSWGDENGSTGIWSKYGTVVEYDIFHIYVNNKTGWAEFDLYAWGTYEAFGGWPGVTTPAAETIDGVLYNVYDFQVAKGGEIELHLIFHNNVGEGQEGDKRHLFDITEARNYYLLATADVISEGKETALDNLEMSTLKDGKIVREGQLYIIKSGRLYNVLGMQVQ